METTSKQAEAINNKIILDNRSKISITGVTKMISSNDSTLIMQIKNTKLCVLGKGIKIDRLDINTGVLEASGEFDSIKYNDNGGLFKRIFKW